MLLIHHLTGFANWFRIQEQEERLHAMKLYDYLVTRGLRVTLLPIEQPPAEWKSPLDVFETTYRHEQEVTGLISDLMTQATKDSDYATVSFLQWYVDEQVEEEANASELAQKLKLITREKGSQLLFMVDKELSQRVFTPPDPQGGA